mgnify:CR=1 FL=1
MTVSQGEDASERWDGPVGDTPGDLGFTDRQVRFAGRIWSVATDVVHFASGDAARDVLLHPGAVAVMALDDEERVLLIRQYRHPVGAWLFEPPAGLLDAPGEHPWHTAQRELAEEAGYQARSWHALLDTYLTPGGSSEAIRIYLARDVHPLEGGRIHTGEAEEAHLPRVWVRLDEAVELVLGGRIGSPTAVLGILARQAARARGWQDLRDAETPWPARDALIASSRLPSDLR